MRRVIIAVNGDGESHVASDEEISDSGYVRLWSIDPRDLTDTLNQIGDSVTYELAQPAVGGANWTLGVVPPGTAAVLGPEPHPGMDSLGFHRTRTVDLVYMLEGRVTLALDLDTVELEAGDIAVLQAANHAWRNMFERPARFLDVLVSMD
jgi:mannose-6-phosphate isomerase-like protein (cupin superfamily)